MKRSLSAPCLAEESGCGSKKCKEERESDEPTSREYLQLALARVLELQRQVKDETYSTDATSDLGESDSEEDVMREVLIKVFKDLPGSSASVSSIINRATQPEHRGVAAMIDKKIQLSGYDTCRKITLDFMNSVVRNTPVIETGDTICGFERGKYSIIEGRKADRKTGLMVKNNKNGGNSRFNCNVVGQKYCEKKIGIFGYGYRAGERNSNRFNIKGFRNDDSGLNKNSIDSRKDDDKIINLSKDYEIRIRMLRGLDLHLADKQRDFTARLMRQ